MNNRERQMYKGNKMYVRSPMWLRMPENDKYAEIMRLVRVIQRSRDKRWISMIF